MNMKMITSASVGTAVALCSPLRVAAILLLAASFSAASAQVTIGGITFDDDAGPDLVQLLPGAAPTFRGGLTSCAVVTTIPGLTVSQSATLVFTDNDVLNWIQGGALVELQFLDNAVVNDPGPDLVVFEVAGNLRSLMISVFDPDSATFTAYQPYVAAPTGTTPTCTYTGDNAALVDLSDFGIAPGADVTRIRLDNQGGPCGNCGSDISQVMALNSEPRWPDIGGGTIGIAGPPKLAGMGPLTGGSQASLRLTKAPPFAATLAWVSFAPTPFPAVGGTIHAFPFATQLFVFADMEGEFFASTTWPGGLPSGTQVWFQFIMQDMSVPAGLTLSNGVLATTP